MGKKMRVFVGWALLFAITGCVSIGKEITADQLNGFKTGETTPDQVIAKLGPPTGSTVSADGRRSMSYVFAHSQARPGSFIPVIGPLVGGTDSRSSNVVFIFGPDGKLANFISSQSQTGMGTGAAGGKYQAPIPDQPQEAAKR